MSAKTASFNSIFPSKLANHTVPTPFATPNVGFSGDGQGFGGIKSPARGPDRGTVRDVAQLHVQKSLAWSTATRFLSLQGLPLLEGENAEVKDGPFPQEVQSAIGLLTDRPYECKGEFDLIDWYAVEVQNHFLAHARPKLNEAFAKPVLEADAVNLLSITTAILQSAIELYETRFNTRIRNVMINRLILLDEVQRRRGKRYADTITTRFSRHTRSMFLHVLPVNELSKALTHVIHAYARDAFRLTDTLSVSRDNGDTELVFTLLRKLRSVGLGDSVGHHAFAAAMDKLIDDFVSSGWVKVDWRASQSIVPKLKKWIEHGFTPFAAAVLKALSHNDVLDTTTYLHKWESMAVERLGSARVDDLFDFILRWPASTGALQDLKGYITTPAARAHLTGSFESQVKRRLLHPGASTSHILDVYVHIINSFYELDPKGVLLERVDRQIRKYLKGREDTARTIVASLLIDIDASSPNKNHHADISYETAKQMLRPISSFQARGDDLDWDSLDWTPDPIDADNDTRDRSDDITAHLFTLYEKEEFINELRTILGVHLLKLEPKASLEKETRLLELFKFRLGEEKMQACEVMLHDVETSRRMNTAIHRSDFYQGSMHNAQLNATILSQFFWPALREDSFNFPPPIAALQEQYAEAFTSIKDMRKLHWLPGVGKVDVELELQDRKVTESVHPWHASVIYAFHSSDDGEVSRSVAELEEMLQMDETLVRASLRFWSSARVLRETAPGSETYAVVEQLSELEASDAAAGSGDADAEPESAVKTFQDQFNEKAQLYKTFIVGMLTNQGNLPAARIQMMLKMVFPGGFPFPDEVLRNLLNGMVDEGALTRQAGEIYGVGKK